MMILDAINSAASEHAVFFLVTAYLESLQHLHGAFGLPESVVTLPVGDCADLQQRLACLRHTTDVAPESIVPASEVSAVLASAVQRLGLAHPEVRENR